MKQVKISDILESVAAKYESGEYGGWTCLNVAIEIDFVFKCNNNAQEMIDAFYKGVENMGLKPFRGFAFDDVEDAQQARMLWLTWCAMMAREQGL